MSLVPGSPESLAVASVLEHFMELEKQLRLEHPMFDVEASQHLVAVADYIKELEHARKTTRELLEMETIETSNLRHRLLHLPGIITKEIEAAVTNAQKINGIEVEQLQNELRNLTQGLEDAGKRQLELEATNSFLCHQGKAMWAEHQQAVDLLNQQMSDKAQQSIALNETHNKRKEALDTVIDFQRRTEDLAEDMSIERQEYERNKLALMEEIKELEQVIEAQNMKNTEKKQSLDQLMLKLFDVEEKANSQREIISNMNDNILLLRASHARLTKKMEAEKHIAMELTSQWDHLEKSLDDMKAGFTQEMDSLNGQISELGDKMKSAENVHQDLTDKAKELKQMYERAREEELREYAKKQDATNELKQSRSALEEKLELFGKLKMEVNEMKKKTENLESSSRTSAEQLTRLVEDLKKELARERESRLTTQVKKETAVKEMERFNLAQEQFISEMNQRSQDAQKKQQSLIEEGTILQRDLKTCDEQIETLRAEQRAIDQDHVTMEQRLTKETADIQDEFCMLNRNLQAEQDVLAANLPILRKTEDTNKQEQHTYAGLVKQAGELKRQKKALENSIKRIGKEIDGSAKIMEMKTMSLKQLRNSSLVKLQNYLESLKLIEKDIYEVNRKSELVSMESCRVKLNCAQFKEDIKKSIAEANQHRSATRHMEKHLRSLLEQLHVGWEDDNDVCKDYSERDQEILDAIVDLITKIMDREEKVGSLNKKLQDTFIQLAALLEYKTGREKPVISH